MKTIKLGTFSIANNLPFVLIAGPCVLESRDVAFRCAEHLTKITDQLRIPLIFKSSFDKANRTSLKSYRGISRDEALKVFQKIKKEFNCPIVTDVHESDQCAEVAEVVDVLQIPAFLCRQTDLLVAAAKTGRVIEIKKGQFLAPWDMKNVLNKVVASGNENVILCERGACFGYNNLVSDMRSLRVMAEYGYPVFFDATHSVQQPGGLGESSGGNREYVEPLARAAIAVGVAGIFIETHFDPKNSPSDGANMLPLRAVKGFLETLLKFDRIAKETPYQDISC